jgi:RNA polymerase sigma-70 factor (ECF subfamily)
MRSPPVPWTEVAGRLRPYVARRAAPEDIDDVLQDVLLRAHAALPALRDDERFTGWLFGIARSALADRGRDRARHPLVRTAEPGEPATAADPDDERGAAEALAACLALFIADLPSPYREALTLVELEGLGAARAAELAGISTSGMKSRVQRGRARLRQALEACCVIALDVRGAVIDVAPRAPARCTCHSPGAENPR